MQRKSTHEKAASAKLTFVLLADAERPARTFKTSKLQLSIAIAAVVVVICTLSILAMIHTPLGRLILPDYFSTQEEQLERVKLLESKVDTVQAELTYLSAYNSKLRTALGDTMSARPSRTEAVGKFAIEEQGTSDAAAPREQTQSYTQEGVPVQAPSGVVSSTVDDASIALPLLTPVNGFVSRDVDYAIQHFGVDISAASGTPIIAPAPGEVIFEDWTTAGGNTLIIMHPGDLVTVYKHCERILVQLGTRVSRGEAIALVGSTGMTSTGPHLHFELWQDGKNLDPTNYLLTKN